jgi:hypothetical protein
MSDRFKCKICDNEFSSEESGVYNTSICLKCEYWGINDRLTKEEKLNYLEDKYLEFMRDKINEFDVDQLEEAIRKLKEFSDNKNIADEVEQ